MDGRLWGCLATFFLVLTSLLGQGTTSRVVGTVGDPTGAVIPGVKVTLTNEANGVSFTTTSTQTGTYTFEAVQVGVYRIEIEAQGFRRFVSGGNRLIIGEPTTINATLQLGATADAVEVTGAADIVQTSTSGNFGSLVEQRVLQDLPIVGTRGRNPLELLYTQPGVVQTDGNMAGGGIYVHGARDRSWNYTLDGIDNNESSYGGSNNTPSRTNPDSLAEFQVITGNGTAEYGRNSGGQVAMITRSGGNELHGTAFFFYRTPRFNANEWENNLDKVGKRQFVQQIPGFSVGGPIKKNRTFFFVNFQSLRTHETGTFTSTVYTATARKGQYRYVVGGRNQPSGVSGASIDSSGNPLGNLNIGAYDLVANDPLRRGQDPTVMKQVNMMPLPNNFNVGDGLNTAGFTYVAPQFERQRDLTFKVDHVLTPHQTVFARVYMGEQDTNCDQVNGGQPAFPGGSCMVNTTRSPRNLAFNWRWNPTPRTTNELVLGQQHYVYNFVTPTADSSIPDITWYSQVTLPVPTGIGNLRTITTYQAVDNFSYVRGAHNFKLGANLRLVRHQDERGSVGGWNVTPIVDFSTSVNTVDPQTFNLPSAGLNQSYDLPILQSMVNFQLGRVGSVYQGFVAKDGTGWAAPGTTYKFDARYPELDFYWQDNWKVRRNLTVDYGLRWEMRMTPTDPANTIKRPNQAVTIGTPPSASLTWQTGTLYNSDRNNFGPSLGIAWDPTGKGKMSLRANYRLAFDRINTFLLSSKIFQNLPGSTYSVANTAFGTGGGRLANLPTLAPPAVNPSALLTPPTNTTNSVFVVDPAYHAPKTHMWALGFQREVFRNTKLEVDYIGRHALNLLGAYNLDNFEIMNNGFLDAFNTVKAGGQSPLMNQLMSVDSRIRAGETGSELVRRLYASNLPTNAVGALAKSIGTRFQNSKSLPELAGLGPYFFVPYPQFMGGVFVIDSNDYSHYNALEIKLDRAFRSGMSFQFSYTLAKSMDTRSFDPTSTVVGTGTAQSASNTPFDLRNRYLNYARSDFDRRHAIQGLWTFELPFGKGKQLWSGVPSAVNYAIGGWQVSGFLTVFSPRPFTVWSGQYTMSSVVSSTADCKGCTFDMGGVFDDAASGFKWFFNQSQIGMFSNPAPGSMGNTMRNAFNQPPRWNMDMSLLKRIRIRERHEVQLRAEATNFTNSVSFAYPTTSISSSTFGRIRNSTVSGSRKIQMALKYSF